MSHCRVEKRVWHDAEQRSDYTCLYRDLEVADTPQRGHELHDDRWFSGPLDFVVWNVDQERFNCRVADEVPLQDAHYHYSHDFLVENALSEGWHVCSGWEGTTAPGSTLHPQLARDCLELGRFPLCRLLLMRDANYPWFILVPDRDGIREIYQLHDADQQQLTRESAHLARTLAERFGADKINIAALGNVVPQLHVHHVVRYHSDPAWPAPIWGHGPARPYRDDELERVVRTLLPALAEGFAAL